MLLTFIFLSLSLLTTSTSSAAAKKYPYYKPVRKRSCMTEEPSVDLASQHEWLMHNEQNDNDYWNGTMIQDHLERYHPSKVRSLSLRDIEDPYVHRRDASILYLYTIDVWVHVVMNASDNNFTSPYYVTKAMITKQINYLNNMYAGASISFNLLGTTWTINDTWAANGDDLNMKRILRKGTYSTLNIYYQTHLRTSNGTNIGIPASSILLGFCSLPAGGVTSTSNPSIYVLDGCNILSGTLPGSYETGYNAGGTTAHEVGHWNGLLHTFQNNNCNPGDYGDYVADTPQESVSTSQCPTSKDSCPNSGVDPKASSSNPYTPQGYAGPDPIHNPMDYSSDACYQSFTPGQGARMANLWVIYRQGR